MQIYLDSYVFIYTCALLRKVVYNKHGQVFLYNCHVLIHAQWFTVYGQ